jgi:pilus assembly protein CpaF
VVAPELESDFDQDFRDAQDEVVEALLEKFTLEDLPLTYPPDQADREEFQKIVRDTVREVKPRRVDREQLIEVFTDECVGLGPLETYLDDPTVQNIYVNQHNRIVLRRDNEIVVGRYAFSHTDFLRVATWRLLGTRDPEVITDEVRFGDGTRVQVTLPPVSVDGPVLTVRKPPTDHPSIDDLIADGVMSPGMGTFLERGVETGRSILVAGPVSSGKTTLLEALARGIPDSSRTIVVEENTQLELPQEGVVRLESRPAAGYDLEQLLDAAVEMHPEKIVLDECRGAEAYTWVSSAASGTDGSMATLHGIDASDALGRLESLCLLGSGDISPRGLREQIARAVDLVVIINRGNDGSFRIQQVTEVQGVDLDTFRLNDVFYYQVDGSSGAFHPTGYVPLFYEDLRHLGMDVNLDIFRE